MYVLLWVTIKPLLEQDMVAPAFNPSICKAKTGRHLCEFEASLVYIVSSRTARATVRPRLNKQLASLWKDIQIVCSHLSLPSQELFHHPQLEFQIQ